MQRLFSTFPRGAPGGGLLLLRVAAGLAAMTQGVGSLVNPDARTALVWLAGLAASTGGLSLLLGMLTPIAGGLVAVTSLALAIEVFRQDLPIPGDPIASFFLVIVALAIVLIGPGAYSLDAHFFGRREIVIPDPIARND